MQINRTWQGYEIQDGKYYLESIYNGIPKFTTDYLYAKKYKTKQKAKAVIDYLNNKEG